MERGLIKDSAHMSRADNRDLHPMCPAEEDLVPLASGEEGADSVRAHVADCNACRDLFDSLQAVRAGLKDLAKDLAPEPDPASRYDCAVGQQVEDLPAVGKYQVLECLGSGGQADVYRAFHPQLSRMVVIKLGRRPLDDVRARERLLVEGRLLARLDHPHLAKVYDLDFHHGRPFLVLELIQGLTASQLVRDEAVPALRAARLVARVARALDAAHRHGVTHRDIKPENILIDEAGFPHLIDFGIASFKDAWSGHGIGEEGISGTVEFMAPEQARGDAERIGPRTDLFALGGILYYLLTGRAPFEGGRLEECLDRARRCDLDLGALRRPGVPRALEKICRKALEADPADRPSSAADFARSLDRCARRPSRFATVGLALLVLLLAVLFLRSPSERHAGADLSAVPLSVKSLEVELWEQLPSGDQKYEGRIGEGPSAAGYDDLVRLSVSLSEPAYCYLIALNPDGKDQVCCPGNPDERPPLQAVFHFPLAAQNGFSLSDGVGLQAFVVLASRKPLPSYSSWRSGITSLPWSATRDLGAWRFDGSTLRPLGGLGKERGPERTLRPAQSLTRLREFFLSRRDLDVFGGIAFPVLERPGPSPAAKKEE
jgi:serine/threonine protein kinase